MPIIPDKIWCKWGTTNYKYGETPYKWSQECILAVGRIISGGVEPDNIGLWQKQHPGEKKRLIELLCIIDSQKYRKEAYANDDAKLTVDDVKLLARYVLGEGVDRERDIVVSINIDELKLKKFVEIVNE